MVRGENDFIKIIQLAPLWSLMGWQDIKQRYRRSILGPFWITLSMGALVVTLSVVWGKLFHQPTEEYLPFLTVGLVIWNFLSTTMTESCLALIEGSGYLRNLQLPALVFPCRVVFRNLLIFFHMAVLPLLIGFYHHLSWNWTWLTIIPALIVLSLNMLWVGVLLGMLSARFRDIPPIIQSLIQPIFYLTPVMWRPAQLTTLPQLIQWNPFFHGIELVRAPFLGQPFPTDSWLVSIGILCGGILLTCGVYRSFKYKITYWL